MATYLPVVKLSAGKYLIGTRVREVKLKEDGCIVRTGGGFMYLNEFLKHHSRYECI